MNKIKYILLLLLLSAFVVSCSDDDDFGPSILDTTTQPMTELDQWIKENFGPFNIHVMYKMTDFETNQELNLVPPSEDNVQSFLETIRRVWMQPYIEQGGIQFFKKTAPKQLMLIGSAGYTEEGLFLLGEAEQGNRITMYAINVDNPHDTNTLMRYTWNFHHEFVHILHQLIHYPPAFEELCSSDYTQNWTTVSANVASSKGFITNYAMADPNEDFAEMVSHFVTRNASRWQENLDAAFSYSQEAGRKLKEKETIILQYMKNNWNIDLYKLRAQVLKEMDLILQEARENN